MQAEDIRVFVPCKNYEDSKTFYTDFGFSLDNVNDEMTLCENGACTFFLQRFYDKQLAENLMMQLCVSDIEKAYNKAEKARHIGKMTPIQNERWGKVFYVWGPSGELWHVTQLHQG